MVAPGVLSEMETVARAASDPDEGGTRARRQKMLLQERFESPKDRLVHFDFRWPHRRIRRIAKACPLGSVQATAESRPLGTLANDSTPCEPKVPGWSRARALLAAHVH